MIDWFRFDHHASLIDALALSMAAALATELKLQSRARLLLSGGRSPFALLQRLSLCDIAWHAVEVRLVDERVVAPDHIDSNARLMRLALLCNAAQQASFLPLVREGEDINTSVERARADFFPPTVTLLGMGEDGHTASLFPDSPQLSAALDLSCSDAYLAVTSDSATHARISATRAALLQSQHLYLAIQGEAKQSVLQQACAAEDARWPISYFIQQKTPTLAVYFAP